jgi:cytochrome P450
MTTTLPPGPSSNPWIQGIRYAYRPVAFLDESARRYGETFTVRMPIGMPFVLFSNPAAIKEILTASDDDLHAGEASAVLHPLLGANSLLAVDGARHTRERRLMLPPFHGERMLAYGETMRDITDTAIDSWPIGRPFPVQHEMQAITLDVILRTVFGLAEPERLALVRERVRRLVGLVVNPIWMLPAMQKDFGRLSPGHRFARVKRDVDELLFAEFARRRAGNAEGDDVLSMLIAARDEDGQAMTDQELRDQMVTLLLAGHETTATALSWAVHHIVENPDVLAAIRAELDRELGGGPVRPGQVIGLEYLDAVVKETLRLRPVIGEIGRVLKRPMRIGGWDLPAGVEASPAIYLTHRRPDLWPDPERFDPQRFIGRRPSPYEFLPFGGGTRRCLGMAFAMYEMKVVLAEMLRRVDLVRAPGYRMRMVRRAITFAPSGGMPVVVEKRAA